MNKLSEFTGVLQDSLDLTVSAQCIELSSRTGIVYKPVLIFTLSLIYSLSMYLFINLLPYFMYLLAFTLTIHNSSVIPTWTMFLSFLLILTQYGSPFFPVGVVFIGKSLYSPATTGWLNYAYSFVPNSIRVYSNTR